MREVCNKCIVKPMCQNPCDDLVDRVTKVFTNETQYSLSYVQIYAVCYSIRVSIVDPKKVMRVFVNRKGYLYISESIYCPNKEALCIIVREGSIWGIV